MRRYTMLPTYRYYEAEGYPLSLGKTAGKPLRNYRIYGNTVDGVGVGKIGKNVFDSDRWYNELHQVDIDNNAPASYATVRGNDGTYDYIQTCGANRKIYLEFMKGEFKENTRYSFSFDCKFISGTGVAGIQFAYDDATKANVLIGTGTDKWTPKSFTTASGKTLLYISIYSYAPASVFQIANIQLEEGTTVTSYEPYKVSLPILLDGVEVANIPLDHPLQDGEYIDYKADNLPTIPTKKFQTNTLTVQSNVSPSKIWCEHYKQGDD